MGDVTGLRLPETNGDGSVAGLKGSGAEESGADLQRFLYLRLRLRDTPRGFYFPQSIYLGQYVRFVSFSYDLAPHTYLSAFRFIPLVFHINPPG